MAISRETKVGLLVVVAGAILYFGFNYLKGFDFFSDKSVYYVRYNDVGGLQPSNPVILNGLSVGQVMSIKINPEDKYKMTVEIEIDEKIRLGDSTVAIISSSLLGDMGLNLKLGYKKGGVNYFEEGDTIYGGQEKDLMAIVEEKLHPIITNVENITGKVDSVFDKDSQKSIKNILSNIEDMSYNFKKTSKSLDKQLEVITGQVVSLTSKIKGTIDKLSPMITKYSALADSLNDADLKGMVAETKLLMSNLTSITSKLDTSTGTLGMLINDPSLYTNLNSTLDKLDVLIEDLDDKGGSVAPFLGDPYKREERRQRRKEKREAKQNEG